MSDSIEVVQLIDAPRERVWAALSQAQHLANWQADRARGGLARGYLKLGWPALGVDTELEVVDYHAERLLVLASGRSRVTFRLEPDQVELTHDGLESSDERDGVRSSWQVSLAVLRHYLDRHFGIPRTVHWSVSPAPSSAAAVNVFYSDQHALNAWLTLQATPIGPAGSRYRMMLRSGEAVSGRVLAHAPDRDLALSWIERDDSALVFRTLPSPFEPDERILALCWSHWGCEDDHPQTSLFFEAALTSLKQLLAAKGNA